MKNCQRVIAVAVVVSMVMGPCEWVPTAQGATVTGDPMLVKQVIELCGVGTEVKVKLASAKKLDGVIDVIDTSGFDLIARRDRLPQRITYEEVTELKVKKSTYQTSGEPSVEQARRVVAGLGVGRHIMVKLTSGKTFRGHIQDLNENHFKLFPDRETKAIDIAYSDVRELGPNLSRGVKIAIIVGAVVGVLLAILAAVAYSDT